jgi:hypothetical protein
MATKTTSKPAKASKNRAKRIPSVKKLESVRPLSRACPNSDPH